MKALIVATALSLTFTAATAQETLYNPNPQFAQNGQWYTAPNGCSYSRTQAPGQPVQWMLILNPHHIGGRNATAACASILRG
ncbi:MAG: hypothetical protein WBC85_02505 [Planktotalea sp.]|uniref:hypothetical protein n=1 Tax=Planktotalea sp. TaxID=2029877 RepID=UPI003C79466A